MSQLETTLNTIRAAFSGAASPETQAQGIDSLELLLSSLQAAHSAHESPQSEAPAPKPQPPKESGFAAPSAKPTPAPDLLDGVIGFLKAQLDAEDRVSVDEMSGDSGFSVPFINV